ncbi:MAG: type I DNA topoisomerase [Candidatus Pacebacteria bacterium]|nr:type I DNA topoisomerase [Candidatus Paceibacterota bacterium]MDD4074014.1 type I DNA topoisomerase [Candidatus Paceibacterota bacterium]
MKSLIIVESPTKANTIKKFLDKDKTVLSSYGHIRDLPKSKIGIDVDNDFEIKYVIPVKARKNFNLLKKEVEKNEKVYIATDPDREGEAIAWHLIEALNLKNYQRISFHEITDSAIKEALNNPGEIDINLVNAQQARRALDRIVGYKLSPFLWKKIMRGLSAGRVQSVALRLIVDREEEIKSFKGEEYWSISVILEKNGQFEATLKAPKMSIKNKEKAEEISDELKISDYIVKSISKKEIKKNPLPPLTTSTLQQEASKKFGYTSKKTMKIAQDLYEKGLITYHRTDSLNLSTEALKMANEYIINNFGEKYYQQRFYKTNKRAQEAHEAIRPTSIKEDIDPQHKKVYDLIKNRFLASQMKEAIFDSTKIEIETNKKRLLQSNGSLLKFDGFLKVYPMKFEEKEVPLLNEKESLIFIKTNPQQHFTQPPARYTEAKLIKELEENEIGRPSTYAPIISTIQLRNYVEKNSERRFIPTEIGVNVNKMLTSNFPEIVDIKFTAKMENDLDNVAEGKEDWKEILRKFYKPFNKNLEEKYLEVEKETPEPVLTDEICPKCGKPMMIKVGRFGKFLACSGFPECKSTKTINDERKKTGVTCPKCEQGELIQKKSKKGKVFYGCPNWPDCDFAVWDKPTGNICPKCNSLMVEKGGKEKCSNKNCGK